MNLPHDFAVIRRRQCERQPVFRRLRLFKRPDERAHAVAGQANPRRGARLSIPIRQGRPRRRAVRHLEKGRVVIFACGTGNPFFSTDTAAALRAVEIGADAILLAKNVDGVYDSDPRVNPEAKLLRDITYQEVQERDLKVMDASAITICRENKVPCIRVFGLDDPQNILRVIEGDMMGTVVHP